MPGFWRACKKASRGEWVVLSECVLNLKEGSQWAHIKSEMHLSGVGNSQHFGCLLHLSPSERVRKQPYKVLGSKSLNPSIAFIKIWPLFPTPESQWAHIKSDMHLLGVGNSQHFGCFLHLSPSEWVRKQPYKVLRRKSLNQRFAFIKIWPLASFHSWVLMGSN